MAKTGVEHSVYYPKYYIRKKNYFGHWQAIIGNIQGPLAKANLVINKHVH